MQKTLLYFIIIFYISNNYAQLDAGNLMGLPTATDLAELTAITGPQIGSMAYNLDDDKVYRYTSTGWRAVDGDNIYNTDGTLTGARTVDMAANQLNFDTDADSRSTITLRRTNNARAVGISFRNSGNAYPGAIALGTTASGNNNGLDFFAGGNETLPATLDKTLALKDGNQIQFSQYGGDAITGTLDNLLGIEADGDVIEVDPDTVGTDDQTAGEVPLVTNVDVNGTTNDPSPILEINVEQAIQAIAPITSKAGRVFYPPSIPIDASSNVTNETVNLYNEYVSQFTGAGIVASSTDGGTTFAPDIPIYAVSELYYYVTYADPLVFSNISIDGNTGIMTYTVIGQPSDSNSLINVIFVVK